jgi:hypothetical protein
VASVILSGDHIDGEFIKELPGDGLPGSKPQQTFSLDLNPYLREGFDKLMQENGEIKKQTRTPTDGTGFLMGLYMLVPLLLMAGFWMTLRRARDPLGNTGFLGGFSKSPAKRYAATDKPVTFADVAGLEVGDRILRIDGTEVQTLAALWQALWAGGAPEREINLLIERADQQQTLKVYSVDRMKTLKRSQGI